MKNLKDVNPKHWTDLTHFRGTGSKHYKVTWKSLLDLEFSQMDLFRGRSWTLRKIACMDVEPGPGLVWTSFQKKTSIQRQHLLSMPRNQPQDMFRCARLHPNSAITVNIPFVRQLHFLLLYSSSPLYPPQLTEVW